MRDVVFSVTLVLFAVLLAAAVAAAAFFWYQSNLNAKRLVESDALVRKVADEGNRLIGEANDRTLLVAYATRKNRPFVVPASAEKAVATLRLSWQPNPDGSIEFKWADVEQPGD